MHIVLFEPEIPGNTGNIARLCAATGCHLHLVRPLGFSVEDKYLKRAGLDYWEHLTPSIYPDWQNFMETQQPERMFFISTHGEKSFFDAEFKPGDYLVFGKESAGLPKDFYDKYRDRMLLIPMPGDFSRSLNLANAASIVLYEAMRQNRISWDK